MGRLPGWRGIANLRIIQLISCETGSPARTVSTSGSLAWSWSCWSGLFARFHVERGICAAFAITLERCLRLLYAKACGFSGQLRMRRCTRGCRC